MNSIDVILLIFVILSAFLAAKRGLLLALLNLGAVLLSGFLARLMAPAAANFVYDAFLHDKIMTRLYEIMPEGSVSGQVTSGIDRILSELPTPLIAMAKQYGLYPELPQGTEFMTVEGIEADYILPLVTGIATIIATVLLFIIFTIILKLIAGAINKSITDKKEHKIINKTNAIAGGIVGIVKSVIPVGICCTVLNLIAPASGNAALENLVNKSVFCGFVANLFG